MAPTPDELPIQPIFVTQPRIGYDSLLAARVAQLREIEERLERYISLIPEAPKTAAGCFGRLRIDIRDMIRLAEAEHDAF